MIINLKINSDTLYCYQLSIQKYIGTIVDLRNTMQCHRSLIDIKQY